MYMYSVCIYIYIYIHYTTCMYLSLSLSTYIYIYREREMLHKRLCSKVGGRRNWCPIIVGILALLLAPLITMIYQTRLYNTRLYYTILYHTIIYQNLLSCTILYYTTLYYTTLYYTILYYTLYDTILYYTILYYTTLYYTILHYTILHYTVLYYTILQDILLYYRRSCSSPCSSLRWRRRHSEGGLCTLSHVLLYDSQCILHIDYKLLYISCIITTISIMVHHIIQLLCHIILYSRGDYLEFGLQQQTVCLKVQLVKLQSNPHTNRCTLDPSPWFSSSP